MTFTEEVQHYADAIMAMIKEDQDSGQVPRDVCSWDELDDTVDAGDYYRLAHLPAAVKLRDAVTDEVARRLASAQAGR